jgi:hypothetical protein
MSNTNQRSFCETRENGGTQRRAANNKQGQELSRQADLLRNQAWEAFQREFDSLYAAHPSKWVAFHGPHLVCIEDGDLEVYQKCVADGLDPDEILIRFISPASLETDTFISQPATETPQERQTSVGW